MSTYIKLFEDFVQDKEGRLKLSATPPDEDKNLEEDYAVAGETVPDRAGMRFMLQSQQKVEAAATTSTTATGTAAESIATTNAKSLTTTVQTTFISPQQRQQSLAPSAVGAVGTPNASSSTVTGKQFLLAKPPKIIVRRPATSPANCVPPAVVDCKKMEHSYMRDSVRNYSELTGLAPTRTVLVRRPPPCSSCNPTALEEPETDDKYQAAVPTYNEIAAKDCMNECKRLADCVKNNNADDEDWESNVKTTNWSNAQKVLFEQVVKILDDDLLARLANAGRPNEGMQRRCSIDKSTSRLRRALVSVQWDRRITQWLHDLLMDHLPPSYMASYMDMLQTLKSKLPTLVDQMLFSRPLHVSQELLAPVLKGKWEPHFNAKSHKLTHSAVIVLIPPLPGNHFKRYENWLKEFGLFAPVHQITYPANVNMLKSQNLETTAEAIVSLTRVKIQELRHENSKRGIILVGFNASAALALQAAMSENIACVICMGFAYNTIHGARGAPDDRILDIKVPILFVIGQNSARTSQEEMESLREKMLADTGLVVVGSSDDYLRMSRDRRKFENVTQAMVDSMVLDEVHDYIEKTLANPPGVRIPTTNVATSNHKAKVLTQSNATVTDAAPLKSNPIIRKRRPDCNYDTEPVLAKIKAAANSANFNRSRPRPIPANLSSNKPHIISANSLSIGKPNIANCISNEDLNLAIQSILGDSDAETSTFNSSGDSPPKMVTNYELVAASKTSPVKSTLFPLQKTGGLNNPALVRTIPSNKIVQLKPATQTPGKIYKAQSGLGSLMTSLTPTQSTSQQIFTLKSPDFTTQYVTAAPSTAQQKFTVVQRPSGGSSLQLAQAANATETTHGVTDQNVDLASIIDMPIVFADNEGNITESVSMGEGTNKPQPIAINQKTSSSGVGQLIINQEIIKHADVTVSPQTPQQQSGSLQRQQNSGKFVFINRHTMKPCTVTNIGNTKMVTTKLPFPGVVNSSKPIAITQLTRASTVSGVSTTGSPQQIIASGVKKLNLQPINSPGVLTGNFTQKSTQNLQFVNAMTSGSQRTMATVQGRSVYVKPFTGQISNQVKQQLMNRNLIVRQVGNQPTVTAISTAEANQPNADTEGTVTMSSSPNMQSLPKIITLNPINSSNVSPPKSE